MQAGKALRNAVLAATAMAVVMAMAGCATGPTIRTAVNPGSDFSHYQTFGWVAELGTDRAGYSTITTNHFKAAVRREMEALGFEYSPSAPDLLVNFHARIEERVATYTTREPISMLGAGYYGYRYGLYTAWPYYARDIDTVYYKVGTANIDVVDADERQLIWEGVIEGRLTEDELDNPRQAIAEAVHELFEEFPTRKGRSSDQ